MIADGHHVAVAANYGLEATMSTWEGIEHFPRGFDAYSQDVLAAYYKDWERQHADADPLMVTLYDVWVYTNPNLVNVPRIASWVPIDHLPIPAKVAQWCAKPNVTPIAMSHYGAAQLASMGIDHLDIPHGIETKVFKPTPQVRDASGTVRTGREIMGIPDESVHLAGIINANKGVMPIRKAFPEQLLAWSIFAKGKDDVALYLHTESGGGMGGIPFDPLLSSVGLEGDDRVKFVNQYQLRVGIPNDAMAAIYTGLDVLLAPTLGEGFGLTVAEAEACGTRAIVNDFTAQPELISDGWKVNGQPYWDAVQEAWFNIPSVKEIVRALEESYERREERHSDDARRHIVANYDADTIYAERWRPALESILRP
jgi:glycosyltransferase involved in cell wall biosynthesis